MQMTPELMRELALQIAGLPRVRHVPAEPERFLIRLAEARAFQAADRRLPSASASDPSEAGLGQWLRTQRSRAAGGSLTAEETVLLEEQLGRHWNDPVARERMDAAWDGRLATYTAFTGRTGRRPRSGSSGEELRLYAWAAKQRRVLADGSRPDLRERLESAMGG